MKKNSICTLITDSFCYQKLIHCKAAMPACSVASVMSDSLPPYGLQLARLLSPWNSPSKNTGVGYHALLQSSFLTQGLKLHLLNLLHCRKILYPLSHLGSPKQVYSNKNHLKKKKRRMTLSFFCTPFVLCPYFYSIHLPPLPATQLEFAGFLCAAF